MAVAAVQEVKAACLNSALYSMHAEQCAAGSALVCIFECQCAWCGGPVGTTVLPTADLMMLTDNHIQKQINNTVNSLCNDCFDYQNQCPTSDCPYSEEPLQSSSD